MRYSPAGSGTGHQNLVPQYRDQIEYRADVGAGLIEHEIVDLFIAHTNLDLVITPNPDEVMDFEWIELETLKARILTSPQDYTPMAKNLSV